MITPYDSTVLLNIQCLLVDGEVRSKKQVLVGGKLVKSLCAPSLFSVYFECFIFNFVSARIIENFKMYDIEIVRM